MGENPCSQISKSDGQTESTGVEAASSGARGSTITSEWNDPCIFDFIMYICVLSAALTVFQLAGFYLHGSKTKYTQVNTQRTGAQSALHVH